MVGCQLEDHLRLLRPQGISGKNRRPVLERRQHVRRARSFQSDHRRVGGNTVWVTTRNQAGAGQTRDIKVRTRQSNLVVRARQSYCDGVALAACSLTFISAAS